MNPSRTTSLLWAIVSLFSVVAPGLAAPQGHDHEHSESADDPSKPRPAQAPLRISGRILNAEGTPLEGAGLAVFEGIPDPRVVRRKPLLKTGADGKFTLTVPRDADATPSVLVSAKGHACMQFSLKGKVTEIEGKQFYLVEVGDLALPRGVDMTGLIRDDQRNALAGARVFATNRIGNFFAPDQGSATGRANSTRQARRIMTAESDEKGVVRLIGMPPTGVSALVSAKGFNSESLSYVNRHMPMVVTLKKAGEIAGTVVDAAGKPIEKARIGLYCEARQTRTSKLTKADGKFSFSYPGRGRARIRVSARPETGGSYETAWSEVLIEPVADLKITIGGDEGGEDSGDKPVQKGARPARRVKTRAELSAPKSVKRADKLVLRVLDAATGKAPTKLQAAMLWWQPNMWEHNRGYLRRQLRKAKIDEQGRVELAAPGRGQPQTGRAMVVAEGYAPIVIKDLEWNDEGANPEVQVKLKPEARLELTVRDTTGKPVVGAQVLVTADSLALQNYVPAPMRRKLQDRSGSGSKLVTDKDGKIKVPSLGYGVHHVYLSHSEYADAEPGQFELKAGDNEKELRIAKGASLLGKIVGVKILSGWQVRIQRLADSRHQFSSYSMLSVEQASEYVPVSEAGDFSIQGLCKANYSLALVMRGGGGVIEIPVGPFRIRSKDLRQEFDVSEELPGTLTGRITVRGAPLPPGRLLMLASLFGSQPRSHYSGRPNYFGHQVPVAASGKFKVRLPEGLYNLRILDVATGVILFQGKRGTKIEPLKTRSLDLKVDVAAVTVKLSPESEGGAVGIKRVEIRATYPQLPGSNNRNGFFGGGNDQYRGVGMEIALGVDQVDLVLPCVPIKLLARSDAHNLDPQVQSYNFPAQGDVEFEPKTGQQNRIELKVSEPEINLGSK